MADIMAPQQLDPGSARAEEFEVFACDAEPLEVPFHGQRGRNKKEEAKLLKVGKEKTGHGAPKPVKNVSQGGGKPPRAVRQK